MIGRIKKWFGQGVKSDPFQHYVAHEAELKIVVGSGGLPTGKGWYGTDIEQLDVTSRKNWVGSFGNKKLSNVFAEHVWEHLTDEQSEKGINNIFEFLKSGGRFRVAVPDGFHPDPDYIEHVRPEGSGPGADDHKFLYTYNTLRQKLEGAGFKTELLEYWDEQGSFHFVPWDTENGKVIRSKRFDSRNSDGKLRYTSLIIDAIKP